VNEVQCGTGTEWRDLIGQQAEAIAASDAIKERLYREKNGFDADANLHNGWLATMQLAWEQPAGTNIMVHYYV